MTIIEHMDHREDPQEWANLLGISTEAVELYLSSEVIDSHIDSFIWHRIFGYDLTRRHGAGLLGARYYSQVDFPRILEAGVTGGVWVITTNPARSSRGWWRAFRRNLAELQRVFGLVDEQFALVRSASEYRRARAIGKHGAFIGIQGGNALDHDLSVLGELDGSILRVTLVHLSSSVLGGTSSPAGLTPQGLSDLGRELVERLNHHRIFVDLAHISREGFYDALAVHDPTQPVLVTHTGVCGVFDHWRNLDDRQLRAVAATGGTIGVMYHSPFLGDPLLGGPAATVIDHIEHIVNTVGDDHPCLGSDWDGAIVTPRDMPTCLELPRLVQLMLDRGWRHERIRKILGGNFLRVVEMLRG